MGVASRSVWGTVAKIGARRLGLPAAATLGALAFTAAPVLAAQEIPEVTVEDTTSAVTTPSTEARLHGVLNPNGAGEAGTYQFVYRPQSIKAEDNCKGAGEKVAPVSSGLVLTGGREEPFETITGLTPGTEYAVCLRVENNAKTESKTSLAVAFTTAIKPETPETGKASLVTATSATLEEGVLNPLAALGEFAEYEYRFRVSATECEGAGERMAPGFAQGGEKEVVPSVVLTELQPNAHYTFCLIEHGFFSGEYSLPSPPGHFTTLPPTPVIVSESVSHHNNAGQPLNPGEARLEGVVNPNDQLTECHFQYGENLVTEHIVSCEPKVLEGFGEQNVVAVVGGLQPGHTYHFQILAKNGKGEEATGVEQTVIPPVAPGEERAETITATTAMLHGVLNPGKVPAEAGSYEFLYNASTSECQHGSATPVTATSGAEESVKAEANKLLPGVTYTFCLLARNKAEETAVGPPVTFTTEAVAPAVGEGSASGVGSSSATLHAQIDPGGNPTTYLFEYGPSYEFKTPVASAGAGSATVSVLANVKELQSETTYNFRVVASNSKAPSGVSGGEGSFSTYPAGLLGLPDRRAYELVSPLNNGDGTPLPGHGEVGNGEAAADGSAVTYVGSAPPVGGNGVTGISGNSRPSGTNAYLAKRSGAGGWTAADIQPNGLDAVFYQGFSDDLSVSVLSSNQALTEGAPSGQALYSRDDGDGSYQLLGTNARYGGSTAGGSHILFESAGGLYDSVGGQLYPVSVLPKGGPVVSEARFGSSAGDLERVISEPDGSRIFWTDSATGDLYVRENDTQPDASTVLIAKDAQYMTASKDGSRVFFTDEEEHLTSNSTAATGAPDLYEYDVENGALIDLSVDSNVGEHANVVGVLGASEDGSYVYFAAAGAIANSGREVHECGAKCNVYVVHEEETPKLVAAVASGGGGDWAPSIGSRSAHVASDGRHLVFESYESLTHFNDEEGEEIYMYDFGSGVSCLSCNPSGTSTINASNNGYGVFIGYPHVVLPASGSATYALRDVSADGDRVFFDSSEQLVSQVADEGGQVPAYTPEGLTNVYEWEREGPAESCPVKSPARVSGGCIFLLSGGTSPDISFFVDASESGDDVFIETRAQLVPQDHGETFEVYDVRVGAQPEPAPSACTASGCQGLPGAPPIFATPAGVTFNGPGNFLPPPVPVEKATKKTVKCAKGKKLDHGKCIKAKTKKTRSKRRRGRAVTGGVSNG